MERHVGRVLDELDKELGLKLPYVVYHWAVDRDRRLRRRGLVAAVGVVLGPEAFGQPSLVSRGGSGSTDRCHGVPRGCELRMGTGRQGMRHLGWSCRRKEGDSGGPRRTGGRWIGIGAQAAWERTVQDFGGVSGVARHPPGGCSI